MKYEPLRSYLARLPDPLTVLKFDDVERIIGVKLPPSARKHAAWWSNSAVGHVNARAWLEAGFKTEQVNLNNQKVVFRRARSEAAEERMPGSLLQRIQAALGGTVTIIPGVDLTEPLWEWVDEDDA